jgi:hypothetical protein
LLHYDLLDAFCNISHVNSPMRAVCGRFLFE